ncbi:MAG: bifunctional 4-hydroxy-2-oxoglutarate aldolase/2-dehydro-3-deoxy-phosphogluconate aldolase [Terriglobia bacterium]
MGDPHAAQAIANAGLIVVLRGVPRTALDPVARALRRGGVRVVEVALNSPQALEEVSRLRDYDFCLGAGTAVEEGLAEAAIDAGAQFLFSPIAQSFFLPLCRKRGVVAIPGGFTPTEIYHLHYAGAHFVKIFPGWLGGPQYVREILAPCEELRLVPAGGVSVDTLEEYFRAGAVAVGVGQEIVSGELIDREDYEEITRRAQSFVEKISTLSIPQAR